MAKRNKLVRQLRRQATSPRLRYLVLTTGAALLAERVVHAAVTSGWRLAYGEDPPRNPERLEVGWGQAFTWTLVTGVAAATAGLMARRGAAMAWKQMGRRIPA